jgi:serine phosphatase RsbU (regulator of sigma subunit)
MNKLKNILLLFFLLLSCYISSQNNPTDSLIKETTLAKTDSGKFNAFMALGNYFQGDINDTALYFHTQASTFAESKKLYLQQGQALRATGVDLYYEGLYDSALTKFASALIVCERALKLEKDSIKQIKLKFLKSSVLGNLGSAYYIKSEYAKAIEYYFKALVIGDEIKSKRLQAFNLGNIGVIYNDINEKERGLQFNIKALLINTELKNKRAQGINYANIGIGYAALADSLFKANKDSLEYIAYYKKALLHYKAAQVIDVEIGNKRGQAANLVNIGNIHKIMDQLDEALKYYFESESLSIQTGDKRNLYTCYSDIGNIYIRQGNFEKAETYLLNAQALAKELNSLQVLANLNLSLSDLYVQKRQKDKAYDYYKTYVSYRDSINNEENTKKLIQQQMQYDYDKKQGLVKAEQQKKDAVAKEEEQKQKTVLLLVMVVLLIVIVFAVFMVNRYKVTQKQKVLIEIKEKETHEQKLLIEEKHKEITDSINYAERIQRSLLAGKELLDEYLDDYFILFLPKDVVSGDFYWAASATNKKFTLVTADSTGHGVPGAIMSILNISCLEKSVQVEKLSEPSAILNHTRKLIIDTLKKDGSEQGGKDGMDCSVCVFDFENKMLNVSAAHNPVWIVRNVSSSAVENNCELIEVKPDKMPVGKHDKDQVPFTQQTIQLQTNDVVYTLTDGFPDQFGGSQGKKFMSKNLKQILCANAGLPMSEQKQNLQNIFSEWKGNNEQVDDVTIIGIRI